MPAMPQVFVTTSWDDDDRSGLKLAELLSVHRLPGTFYVPTGRLGRDSLFTAGDLRTLSSAGFEIGGHTVTHAILTELSPGQQAREIGACKSALQQILGREVTMFCYPKGRFNAQVISEVRRSGYRGARATQMLCCGGKFHPFAMPFTMQAYPHNRSNYLRNLLRLGAVGPLLKSSLDLIQFTDWLTLGKKLFDRVRRQGGVWHLSGHPWELEKLQLWPQVREMLEYVSNQGGVQYLTNGQLVDSLHGQTPAGSGKPIAGDPQRVAD
jgi:peptidoglycan-N-acetylglucosamine deacetylase